MLTIELRVVSKFGARGASLINTYLLVFKRIIIYYISYILYDPIRSTHHSKVGMC